MLSTTYQPDMFDPDRLTGIQLHVRQIGRGSRTKGVYTPPLYGVFGPTGRVGIVMGRPVRYKGQRQEWSIGVEGSGRRLRHVEAFPLLSEVKAWVAGHPEEFYPDGVEDGQRHPA